MTYRLNQKEENTVAFALRYLCDAINNSDLAEVILEFETNVLIEPDKLLKLAAQFSAPDHTV